MVKLFIENFSKKIPGQAGDQKLRESAIKSCSSTEAKTGLHWS
jgi:hypothetical protein